MTPDEDRDTRTMAFLKPEQVDTSLLKPETPSATLQCVRLNSTVAEVVGIDEDLAQSIREALPIDVQIGPYLEHLSNETMLRVDC